MLKPAIVLRIVLLGLFLLAIVNVTSAIAAANTIAPSNLGFQAVEVNADDLKPEACGSITLNNVVSGAGTIIGTSNNDLIIGSSGDDVIDGMGGNDCIIGGGGDDSINGNSGTDICIGGEGTDTFLNCETSIP